MRRHYRLLIHPLSWWLWPTRGFHGHGRSYAWLCFTLEWGRW